MKNKYNVIGVMSGTSMDGLDIAHCTFLLKNKKWQYQIVRAETIRYPKLLSSRLLNSFSSHGNELAALDVDFGKFIGASVVKFISKDTTVVDFIASHGHTVFHQPNKGFTLQIGNGNAIHAITGLPVIYDFRSLDVILGGQGAPLVPVGDHHLFGEYDICLNLGGIANLSAMAKKQRIAFDICYCNMPLNYLMKNVGQEMDRGGFHASKGEIDTKMLKELRQVYNSLTKARPALGRELFDRKIRHLLDRKGMSMEDKLATCVESTAMEIIDAAKMVNGKDILCTGGGAYNSYLMSRLLHHAADTINLVLPEDNVIKFKEAMVFGFLGVLRSVGETNCWSSVTKAKRDSSGGVMVGF